MISALFLLSGLIQADQLLLSSTEYEDGEYGLNPVVTYESTDVSSPLLNIARWDDRCKSEELIFLAPHGDQVPDSVPTILDSKGRLVWTMTENSTVNSLQVQRYNGSDYLVYWVGDNELGGHGTGIYKMLDNTYTLFREVRAMGNLTGDPHEFSISADDTALITAYDPMRWDLSRYENGSQFDGWVYDSVFQEIDLEFDTLVFEWRASEHFTFDDMHTQTWDPERGDRKHPWDWFHINSVEKDSKGNYLISSRYSDSITYINGSKEANGQVLWNLGGTNNSFTDLSDGRATTFIGQHMARFRENEQALTLFDNNAYWGNNTGVASALQVAINQDDMYATLVHDIIHPDRVVSESQGSFQVLPNGNFFIGWGHASAFTEHNPEGDILCDWHFAPLLTPQQRESQAEPSMQYGYVQNYRTVKQHWTGFPKDPPRFKISGDNLYVSWNGATQVRWWHLATTENNKAGGTVWSSLDELEKDGFETRFIIDGSKQLLYRLTATNSSGHDFGSWIVNPGTQNNRTTDTHPMLQKDVPSNSLRSRPIRTPLWAGAIPVLVIISLLAFFGIKFPRYIRTGYHKISQR